MRIDYTIYHGHLRSKFGNKYILKLNGSPWVAFKTETGFHNFLGLFNPKIKIVETVFDSNGDGFTSAYSNDVIIIESFFCRDSMPQPPKGIELKETFLLSNGEWKKGYAYRDGDTAYIFRHNPDDPAYQQEKYRILEVKGIYG